MDYLAPLRIKTLVSHPPTLEELFLREFGDHVETSDPTGVAVEESGALR